MATIVEAVYEQGTLKLLTPVSLPEKSRVTITIHDPATSLDDPEGLAWRKLSGEALDRLWGSFDEDVFNRLLKK